MTGSYQEYKRSTEEFVSWIVKISNKYNNQFHSSPNTLCLLTNRSKCIIKALLNRVDSKIVSEIPKILKLGNKAIDLRISVHRFYKDLGDKLYFDEDSEKVQYDDTHAFCIKILKECCSILKEGYKKILLKGINSGKEEVDSKERLATEIEGNFDDNESLQTNEPSSRNNNLLVENIDKEIGEVKVQLICSMMDIIYLAEKVVSSWERLKQGETSILEPVILTFTAFKEIQSLEAILQLSFPNIFNSILDIYSTFQHYFPMKMFPQIYQKPFLCDIYCLYFALSDFHQAYTGIDESFIHIITDREEYFPYFLEKIDGKLPNDYEGYSSFIESELYYLLTIFKDFWSKKEFQLEIIDVFFIPLRDFFENGSISLSLAFNIWSWIKMIQILSDSETLFLSKTSYLYRNLYRVTLSCEEKKKNYFQRISSQVSRIFDFTSNKKDSVEKEEIPFTNELFLRNIYENIQDKSDYFFHLQCFMHNPYLSGAILLSSVCSKLSTSRESYEIELGIDFFHLYHLLKLEGFISKKIDCLEIFIELFQSEIFPFKASSTAENCYPVYQQVRKSNLYKTTTNTNLINDKLKLKNYLLYGETSNFISKKQDISLHEVFHRVEELLSQELQTKKFCFLYPFAYYQSFFQIFLDLYEQSSNDFMMEGVSWFVQNKIPLSAETFLKNIIPHVTENILYSFSSNKNLSEIEISHRNDALTQIASLIEKSFCSASSEKRYFLFTEESFSSDLYGKFFGKDFLSHEKNSQPSRMKQEEHSSVTSLGSVLDRLAALDIGSLDVMDNKEDDRPSAQEVEDSVIIDENFHWYQDEKNWVHENDSLELSNWIDRLEEFKLTAKQGDSFLVKKQQLINELRQAIIENPSLIQGISLSSNGFPSLLDYAICGPIDDLDLADWILSMGGGSIIFQDISQIHRTKSDLPLPFALFSHMQLALQHQAHWAMPLLQAHSQGLLVGFQDYPQGNSILHDYARMNQRFPEYFTFFPCCYVLKNRIGQFPFELCTKKKIRDYFLFFSMPALQQQQQRHAAEEDDPFNEEEPSSSSVFHQFLNEKQQQKILQDFQSSKESTKKLFDTIVVHAEKSHHLHPRHRRSSRHSAPSRKLISNLRQPSHPTRIPTAIHAIYSGMAEVLQPSSFGNIHDQHHLLDNDPDNTQTDTSTKKTKKTGKRKPKK